jgi:hypothetical protein
MWSPVINTALNAKSTTTAVSLLATPTPSLPPVIGKELMAPALVATGLDWTIDIAGTAVGSRPGSGFVYELGGDSNSLKVIQKSDAPGGKCLAYTDSASFKNSYEPMAFAKLNHTAGTTTVEFSLQIDANTTFWHEWRDDSSPYVGGPTMFISSKGVQVMGTTVASVDVGQWTKFKLVSPMGQQNSVWRLEMTRANGERVSIGNLPMKNPKFTRLNWLHLQRCHGSNVLPHRLESKQHRVAVSPNVTLMGADRYAPAPVFIWPAPATSTILSLTTPRPAWVSDTQPLATGEKGQRQRPHK